MVLKFSIIIPVYNVGSYFDACLESIQKQAGEWECILIDDGSSDGSEKKCDRIAGEDSRFKVFHQKNSGVSSARNRGLEAASGEWIWFVDADDVIHPDALVCLNAQTAESSADFIYFDFVHDTKISFEQEKLPCGPVIKTVEKNIPEMSQWRCIFKRGVSTDIKFENFVVGEDLLFCAKLSAKASQIGYLPACLYGYVKRESSVMHSKSFRKTRDSILWMKEILVFYGDLNKAYYRHLEKSRWNKFFFGTSFEIIAHHKEEKNKLIKVWFESISNIELSKAPFAISLIGRIYNFFCHISFLQKIAIEINAFIFSAYVKLGKRNS